MGLAASISGSILPSSNFAQDASADDSLKTVHGLSLPDNVLSKAQFPHPLLSHPELNPDTNPISPAPLDTKPICLLHSGTSESQNHDCPLSHSCLSQTVELQSQQTRNSDPSAPSQTIYQIPLLSTPLSNLSQSGGMLANSPVATLPLHPFQAPSRQLLPIASAPLSSLSAQVGARSLPESLKTAPQSHPLLSCKPVPSPLSFPSSLLSAPLSTLSQTPASLLELQPDCHQDSLLSASLSSLSQSGSFSLSEPLPLPLLSSSSSSTPSEDMESQASKTESLRSILSRGTEMPLMAVHLHVGTQQSGTTHSLDGNLQNMKTGGNASNINPGEKGYNQNHKVENKPSAAPMISSTHDPSVDQEGTQSLYARDKKPIAPPAKQSVNIYNKRFCQKYVDKERQLNRTWDNTPISTAKPTMFALALCHAKHSSAKISVNKTVAQNIGNKLYNYFTCVRITPFDFCSPSPDDVVNEKQKGAFSRKK